MKLYPVTLVDNFYDNPDAIQKFALAQKYQFLKDRPETPYVYPGCRTKDLYDIDQALHAKVLQKLESVFHIHEHDFMRWAISTSFQCVTQEYGQGVIHQDDNTIFAAVLYLTPDAPLDSGTSLFKTNKSFDQAKYKSALAENDGKFKAGKISMDTSYHSMFDEVVRISNVYNILILYEGDTFHAANNFFGNSLKNGRLAQVFFINKIDANKVNPLNRVKGIKI